MTQTAKKKTNKVPAAVRLSPQTQREIERLAARAGEKPGPYIRQILDSHVKGMAFCHICQVPHAFHPGDHSHGR